MHLGAEFCTDPLRSLQHSPDCVAGLWGGQGGKGRGNDGRKWKGSRKRRGKGREVKGEPPL